MIMPDYGSIHLNSALECFNMPQYPLSIPEHDWELLNVPENTWINSSDYARVLNMPQNSYNNIIIIIITSLL